MSFKQLNFYVPKTWNAFFRNNVFARGTHDFWRSFQPITVQIFYVHSKHKYLWSEEAVYNIFNFTIVKFSKNEQEKVDFWKILFKLSPSWFLQNKKNPLRHFRAMVILIKRILDLFVSDDDDWVYRARHGHAFFYTLFIVKHYLNSTIILCKKFFL